MPGSDVKVCKSGSKPAKNKYQRSLTVFKRNKDSILSNEIINTEWNY